MSNFEMREGQVFVFKNKDKDNPKALADGTMPNTQSWPPYKGRVMLNGKEMGIALWVKKDKNGQSFFSGKIEEFKMPDEVKKAAGVTQDDLNDDIPW